MDAVISSRAQGQRVRKARKMTLLSRRGFAQKHGFHASALQAWEDGKYKGGISLESALTLVEALSRENITCSPEWILYGTGDLPRRISTESPLLKKYSKANLLEVLKHQSEITEKNFELIAAIKADDARKVLRILSQGANLHQLKGKELYFYGTRQDTALHFAAAHASDEIIGTFIKLGVHPNIRNRHVDAPLHIACLEGNLKAIASLIQHGAGIESASREGATPLMWAAYMGNVPACEMLIKKDADVNNTDLLGNSAIHWAAYNNKPAIIHLLYKKGGIPDTYNHDGKTPIDWALLNGNREALETLIQICQIK